MKKTAILSILLCLCMVASLVLVPMPQATAAEVDTSKLEGVYEVVNGDLMYTMTFDNGKLTIVDTPAAAMFPLAGEYTYTVVDGVPTVEGANFMFGKDLGGNYTLSIMRFPMTLTLTKVAELGGNTTPDTPAIDTSKLEGVYEVVNGDLMYTMTFDNGKLTIVDTPAAAMFPLAGEYTYTVVDGVPTVEGVNFMFGKDLGGNYTLSIMRFPMTLTLTKVAELGGTDTPDEPAKNTITVTTTDTYNWIDKFSFTADKAGDYIFTVPAGLSVANADDKNAAPYIDFQLDHDGGEFTVTLAAGQTINFCFSAASKAEWTITWRMAAEILSGTINVTTTETYAYDAEFTFTAPADGEYTFTLPAGLGVVNADKKDAEAFDACYVDYYTNNTGAKFTVTLTEGQTIRFYAGSPVNAEWVIEWTNAKEEEKPQGNVAVLGENTVTITDAIINEGGVAYTFTVEVAGNYTFTLGTLRILIVDASGRTMNANEAELQPGTYTLRIIMDQTVTAGDHIMTITTDAEPVKTPELVMGENTVEIGEADVKDGVDYIFVVTEAGTYYFDGQLGATIQDANGMYISRYQATLEPGTYIITLFNADEVAGTFTVIVSTKTEEQLKQEAINNVIAMIEAIGEVTVDSKDAIVTAREFYNALSDESKALVTNLSVLEAAEEALAKLENPEVPTDPTEPTTPPTQPTEPTTHPTQPTEPTTPATQPNGNGGNENNGTGIVIVIVVVAAVAIVAVVVLTKKKKA